MANIIKGFFRGLPGEGLIGKEGLAAVKDGDSEDAGTRLIAALPPLERGLLQWLVRVPPSLSPSPSPSPSPSRYHYP